MHLFSLLKGQEPRHRFKSILHTAADNPDTRLLAGLLCSRAKPSLWVQLPHCPPGAGEEACFGLDVPSGPCSIFSQVLSPLMLGTQQ